ncbi:hypothetical protein SLS60_009596 [Paraconiothyrium brasiliense]|uniref:Uncharacterized protein n=1 Tax=Paraconiothyrium brasiliense TaxID=300254 RepID=A0ABR3QUU0_9PLEO
MTPFHNTTSQREIARRVPISMLALFISGILVSVGHHLFYSRLDGTVVQSAEEKASRYVTQIWIIRYGTAFAFLAKTLLASAVVIAYKQHIWINLRSKANSIATINVIFAATHDFLAAMSPDLFVSATVPALLALATWFLPLAALVTPSTLTVIPDIHPVTSMLPIPTLNLNDASLYSFYSLGSGVSPLVTRLVSTTTSGMEILPMAAIFTNSSYEHTFTAPSLKCEVPTGKILDCIDKIWNATSQDPTMIGSGGGSLKYLAFIMDLSDVELYCQHKSTSYDFNEAEFISKYVTGTTPYPASGINQFISVRLANETTHCAMHDTRSSLNFTAAGSTQSISFMDYEWNKEASDAVSSQLLLAIADILNGAIGAAESGPVAQSGDSGTAWLVSVRTRIMETALIGFVSTAYEGAYGGPLAELPDADRKLTKNKTLPATLEELSRNVTLSLLSSDRLC